ncbi:hypothetical protein FHS18_002238 [Paenibacillus phyllosphaerae]|uniref:Probable membrane transporter protein n=2 Tax=Paenibacillus phyllosphaerae TaxID=274593 RepID=A0A7W5FME4_9BACL|nr:hypothetical protein [Paenibacillus phyllosphaerae]
MDLSIEMIVLIVAGGFLAAFVDSVVGGGGLIAVPVLLAAGLPPHLALGTNKLAGTMSSLTSMITFARSGHIDTKLVKRLFPITVVGACGGTLLLQTIPSDFLRPLITALLVVITAYTLLRKSWGERQTYSKLTRRTGLAMAIAALGLGAYDGFFGPGTGSFLIFVFLLLGFDFVRAAGNAKVLNFGSNIASLVTFMLLGSVDYRFGLLMGVSMVIGSLVGSRMAIRKGASYVRPLFLVVSLLLIGKQVWTMLF